MSQVLITGATGLVGGHLLRMLINEPKVNAIAAPTRRPLGDMPGVFNPHDRSLTRLQGRAEFGNIIVIV